MAECTLRLGDDVVLVASGGVPEAEYLLFDPADIELHASEPGTIREFGFRTTAGDARGRLEDLGVTADHAQRAAQAAKPAVARAYARGAAVRCVADIFDAVELFEGETFEAQGGGYQGAWLDLRALAADLDVPGASCLLQTLHLAALLAERDDEEPLVLETLSLTASQKPGARTYRRPRLASPDSLVIAIGALRPTRTHPEAGPAPQDIVARLKERTRLTPASRDRMRAVEAALLTRRAPTSGPLADPELWAVEQALDAADADTAMDRLDAIERRRGRLPATLYLRARGAMLTGREDPHALATRVSALSTSMPTFHELQLLAAQAWSAAGDARRAAAFARDLADNASVADSVRMHAQSLVRRGGDAGVARSKPPPPSPRGSSRGDLRPPSLHPEPLSARWSAPPPSMSADEALDALGLPSGALDVGNDAPGSQPEHPRTPLEARVHCTLLARELGRSLRELHGTEVRCDVDGLEVAQRYLREAIPDAAHRSLRPEEQKVVARHGALLAELLSRRLGARWADLEAPEPARWAMLVPVSSRSDAIRVWPFARVARFVAMGHRERDLVSYYLELESRAAR